MDSNDNPNQLLTSHIEGKKFDAPLIMTGAIDKEPERYVAEKPYDLTRYEYSVLKKPYIADLWFNLVSGATGGVVITVIGKAISSLIQKQSPSIETWEIIAIALGVVISYLIKKYIKSNEDQERCDLVNVIDNHFSTNKPRRLHLTKGDNHEN